MPDADAERSFPCDRCGNQLVFAPGQTSLACPYCGHVQAIPEAAGAEVAEALEEQDYAGVLAGLARGADYAEARVVACPNCGAEVEFPPGTEATTCPFCATPLVATPAASRRIRPAALIPFRLTEPQAREAMRAWLGSLWFAPNGLQDYARGRRLDGVYVPYWTFDADTATRYRGRRGDNHVVTRTVMRDGRPTQVAETRIRWRAVSGRVARAFDDVLVLASRSLPKAHTDALEPWGLDQLTPWRADFLAGFAAEGYAVDLPEAFAEARAIMDRAIEGDIRADIGGDHQRIGAKATDVRDVTFKHVLLPVWMAAYRYGGRSFRFVVNGQTGRVRGERPYSRWKIAGAVLLALLAATVAFWLYREYGQGDGATLDGGYAAPSGDGPTWLNER